MSKNIFKAVSLFLITIFSLYISSYFINDYVLEVEAKEKTIADMIVKQQMQAALKEAEEKIEAAKKEENIVIETEKVEMKPPVVVEKPIKEEVAELPEKTEENIQDTVEESIPEPVEDTNTIIIPGLGEFAELDEKAVEEIGNYLVDNYFLNGFVYAENETDPERKAEKELVRDMETYVVNSLQVMIEILDNIQTLKFDGIDEIRQNVEALSVEFKEKYLTVEEYGPEFAEVYSFINQYFDKSLFAIDKTKEVFDIVNTSPNPVLAITVVLSSMEKDIMPALKDILNSGFDLKEKTNAIYLEGVEGKALMSKEEVKEIIKILEKAVFK